MRHFISPYEAPSAQRQEDHGGIGSITFRRLMTSADFLTKIDFVDFTLIGPGSTIGNHQHVGNEELYLVLSGTPLVRVNGEERRLTRSDIAVVRSGESHELINDSPDEVEILVVQVSE